VMPAGEKFEIRDGDACTQLDEGTDLLCRESNIMERFIAREIEIKPEKSLTHLRKFVEVFNEIFTDKGKKSLIVLDDVKLNTVCRLMQARIDMSKGAGRMDPIFISGVQALLELMYGEREDQ